MRPIKTCLLIDDAGRERPWPAPRRADHARRPIDFDFPGYAVRNLGHVMVVEDPAFTRLWLRPLFVGRHTVAGLLQYLSRRQPARTAISFFDDDWRHEVCGDTEALFQRLAEILEAGIRELPAQAFIAVRRTIATILESARDPFGPLLRRWLDGAYPEDLPAFLESCGLYDRAMIVERETDGEFFFRHSGARIQLYDKSWSAAAIGRRVQDQPDQDYGRWIAEACRAVDDRQVPRYELITARVDHPARSGHHWRYERLMLPWRLPHDRRIVVSVSLRDQADPR